MYYDDDDDSAHDVFEESQESRDITPRQSSVPPAAVSPVSPIA
jgi:hypothetical protein